MTAFERVLDKLTAHGSTVRTTGEGRAQAQCPAHEDSTPSLSLLRIEGRVLVNCHAGCPTPDVLDALHLTMRDLFDEPAGASYRYTDLAGTVLRTVSRTPDKRFSQVVATKGPSSLYRLPQVVGAVATGRTVHLVEGEQDVNALEAVGVVATTAPMGAGSFHLVDPAPLTGATVVAVVDRDDKGRLWAEQVREKLDGVAASLRFVEAAEGKDAADHLTAGHTLDELRPLDLDQEASDRARRLFPRLDWHALWADQRVDEWIHDPLLPARRSVSVYSAPKVGKSLLILELAVGISRGERVLGYTPAKRWRVLYVDFENDPRGDVRSRLQAMGYTPDDLDHLDYLSYPPMSALDTERGALELLEAVKAYRSEVVVVDTVSRAVDGEENSNDTWLALYRHTGLALKRAGVAIIRLDHSGKDESKGTRGGSAKSGDVDAIWKLTRVADDRFRLECTEARMMIPTKSLHLTRRTLPRLRHDVNAVSGVTDREAKVAHIVALADDNALPADAPRQVLADLVKSHGMSARTEVLAEVVRVRRAAAQPVDNSPQPVDRLFPTLGNTDPPNNTPGAVPDGGDSGDNDAANPGSEHETLSPPPREHLGTRNIGLTVPSGSSIYLPEAGQRDNPAAHELTMLDEFEYCGVCHRPSPHGDLHDECDAIVHPSPCSVCGQPLSWQRKATGESLCLACAQVAS